MIKIIDEMYLEDFEFWGQAVENFEIIKSNGKVDELENWINEAFPDGCSSTAINDLLAYDWEYLFEILEIEV